MSNQNLPGLTGLQSVDRVFLKKSRADPMDPSRQTKYLILDCTGRELLHAFQTSGGFLKSHDFDMSIMDFQEKKVIELYRPHNFLSSETMKVFSPPGKLISRIIKKDKSNTPKYDICRADRTLLYTVKGSAITLLCGGDVEFKILSVEEPEEVIGRVSRQWTGLPKDVFATSQNVGVSFPEGVSAETKAIFIATCIFIQSMHYSN